MVTKRRDQKNHTNDQLFDDQIKHHQDGHICKDDKCNHGTHHEILDLNGQYGYGPCPPLPECEYEPNEKINPNPQHRTLCQIEHGKHDNIFFVNGKCKLDELTWQDLFFILERIPVARRDLCRITTEKQLHLLARESSMVTDIIEDDQRSTDLINENTIPTYTVFKGNIGGDINVMSPDISGKYYSPPPPHHDECRPEKKCDTEVRRSPPERCVPPAYRRLR
jgi:hypothetical protein